MKKKKKISVTIRLDPDLLKKLKAEAREEERDISKQIRKIIADYYRSKEKAA